MNLQDLDDILSAHTLVEKDKIMNYTFAVTGLSFLKIRDILIVKGNIIFEDLENKVYVAFIRSGFMKKSDAKAAIHLYNEQLLISIYAKEGIVNQRICEGAINELEKSLKDYIG
ncbi:hypothetical protein [Ruminococcus albus]|uniref:Uncharacterized protein n=1 Tax=Ruminococcus albus (strain ATCC 27210 / DSM 20455 / JCM 14654 / NCDO 2250 / 7) TaxID=697329 RepID=E6UD61_RUMA7|nr:hypothetical protein [Ruminococcus albus]ADU21666.1 hypothetical protein Rumal_1144 [Ruminococcus albus 7 = DSM 20455]